MYIILEYYLLENFIINFLVLYATNIITKSKQKIKGIVIGTIVATIYSLVIFLPSFLFLSSLIFKILISGLIVYITFSSKSKGRFLYQWLCFYIVSFIFAGAIMALSSNFTNIHSLLTSEINLFEVFTIKHILIGIIIALIISLIVFGFNHRKKQLEKIIVDARIIYKDNEIGLNALVDTGNTLKEPLTNRSVFVVEVSKLQSILPKDLINYYREGLNVNLEDLLLRFTDRFPLILLPFKSIGNERGLILGFKPDKVIVRLSNELSEIEIDKLIIGIYNGKLSNEGEFSGLLDYDSISGKEEKCLS